MSSGEVLILYTFTHSTMKLNNVMNLFIYTYINAWVLLCASSFTPTQKTYSQRYHSSSPTSSTSTSSSSSFTSFHPNNSFVTSSLYSTYRRANGKSHQPTKKNSSSSRHQSEDRTELNRTKLLLSQARGNLKESEMRATAAENRVARLTQEMKLLTENKSNGQSSNTSTINSTSTSTNTSSEDE